MSQRTVAYSGPAGVSYQALASNANGFSQATRALKPGAPDTPDLATGASTKSTGDEVVIICVFPLPSEDDLADDEDDFVDNPMEQARLIFWMVQDNGCVNTTEAGFPEFAGKDTIPGTTYRAVCRQKFFEIIQYTSTGLDVSTHELVIDSAFDSSDKKEFFVSFALPNKGQAVKELAAKFSYSMPYNKRAYEDAGAEKAYILKNADGDEVLGHTAGDHYDPRHQDPFRNVDCIRLFDRQMTKWCNKEELCKQGVMSRWFYPELREAREDLQQKWGRLWRFWQCPPKAAGGVLLEVRDYLGEEITFFYYMFAHVIWFLWPYALLSFIFMFDQTYVDGYPLPTNTRNDAIKRGCFAALLIVGTSIFTARLGSVQHRAIQRWGMTEYDTQVDVRQEYDPNQPYQYAAFWKGFGMIILGLYMLLIIIVNIALSHSGSLIGWEGISMKVVTVGMLGLKIMWTPIARMLTNKENQRDQNSWNDSLALKLAIIQIFNVMLPFVVAGFGAQYIMADCRPAADWEGDKFEELLGHKLFRPLPESVEQTVFTWWTGNKDNDYRCLSGCVPLDDDPNSEVFKQCKEDPVTSLCATTCQSNLYQLSLLYYVSYIGIDLGFIVLAYAMVAYYTKSIDLEDEEEEVENDKRKRWEYQGNLLEFKVGSWAGSLIEDSIEIALLFAPVLCFAIIEPKICILCVITCLILYRTMAWKMFVLVARPYPKAAVGMGIWLSILSYIGYVAVAVQVAFFVYVLHPMRTMTPATKAAMFIGLEHTILVLAVCFRPVFTETPKDVEDIEDMILVMRREQALKDFGESGSQGKKYDKIKWEEQVNPRLLQHEHGDVKETSAIKQAFRGLSNKLKLDAPPDDDDEEEDDGGSKCVIC